jgi:hypothetical protein
MHQTLSLVACQGFYCEAEKDSVFKILSLLLNFGLNQLTFNN